MLLYLLHRAFDRFASFIWPEPVRYAIYRSRHRRALRPIDRQIADARRGHRPTRHLIAAKQAVVNAALAGGRR